MMWLKQLFIGDRRYNELSESTREHLDEKIADLMEDGMTLDEAERAARREFGNVTRIEERGREVWQSERLEATPKALEEVATAVQQAGAQPIPIALDLS